MITPGKFLLSSGLVVASGAYAWWQHQSAPLPPLPVPHPVAVEANKPAAPAAPSPVTQAAPQVAASAPVAPAAPANPQAADAAPVPEKKLALAQPRDSVFTPQKAAPQAPSVLADALPAPAAPPAEVAPAASPPPAAPPLNAVVLAPPPAISTGRYADGEFVGNAVDDEWGPVQVKVVIKNGDIADVICIEYPYHRRRSAEISEWAIPTLIEESIKAQSEKIDWVSQASFTSDQFRKSLASALARAKKPT